MWCWNFNSCVLGYHGNLFFGRLYPSTEENNRSNCELQCSRERKQQKVRDAFMSGAH